jgi:hypothetical protein
VADNMDRYVPEFDEPEVRAKLAGLSVSELTDMLIYAYKEKRALAKIWGETSEKLRRIKDIADEPSQILSMPGVPGPDDLRRLFDEDQ